MNNEEEIQLKRRLNAYKWNDELVEKIRLIVAGLMRPNKAFINKFGDFSYESGHAFYIPTKQIVIIDPAEKKRSIEEIYNKFGLGSGADNLYEKCSRRYINITRNDVRIFLNNDETYQLQKTPGKIANRKIVSQGINKTWGMDLMDLNPLIKQNRNYRYLFVCVDYFTKFVMMEKLKNKNASTVKNVLKNIVDIYGKPSAIISDNGLEFKNETMADFCEDNAIKQIFGLSHSPKSNSLAENANHIIRYILRSLFIKTMALNWEAHLDEIMESINDTKAESTGVPRSDLFYNSVGINKAKEEQKKRREVNKDKNESFKVGDYVRISMYALEAKVREKYKAGEQKYVSVRFSPQIYKIVKVYKSKSPFLNNQYVVEDDEGDELESRFFGNDLQKTTLGVNKDFNKKLVNKLNQTTKQPYQNLLSELY